MDCPAGVDIPRVFSIYNHFRTRQHETRMRVIFNYNYHTLDTSAQAHSCVACGACLEHCPQAIDIPKRMQEIADFAANP